MVNESTWGQEDFDEPLPAFRIGVVHVYELVQEEPDVFLLQTQLLLQPGCRQSHPEPLPGLKELTGTLEDHWSRMIHEAIAPQSKTTQFKGVL